MVDTGASLNLHGTDWFKSHAAKVLDPNCFTTPRRPGSVSIGEIGGSKSGSSEVVSVPAAMVGYLDNGSRVFVRASMNSSDIHGGVPALVCYPRLRSLTAAIDCLFPQMTIAVEEKQVAMPLVATSSGHLTLPIGNSFGPEDAKTAVTAGMLSWYKKEKYVADCLSDPLPNFVDGPWPAPSMTLEAFLEEGSAPESSPSYLFFHPGSRIFLGTLRLGSPNQASVSVGLLKRAPTLGAQVWVWQNPSASSYPSQDR